MEQQPSRHQHVRLHLPHLRTSQLAICLTTWLLISPQQGHTTIIEIFPPATVTCDEQFENVANSLKPGDELVLRGGAYSQNCYRAITVNGTAANPIIIRAATGEKPVITRPAASSQQQNNIDIAQSSYLIIRGLHFRGGDGGVRLIGGHHITIEDCEISETLNNGLRANTGNADALIFRRNHIHHTGLNTTRATEGEGIYLGCHDGSCRVTTKRLNEQVKRNRERFPSRFMFQLTTQEVTDLRSHFATSRWGGRRTPPYAFTEHGTVMLASVLNSPIAIQASIEIVQAFVRLRQMLASHVELARKLAALEKKYDAQFKVVFDAIRQLMEPPPVKRRSIGFHTAGKKEH